MSKADWKVLDSSGNEIASPSILKSRLRAKMFSAYRGASTNRTQSDWSVATGSADDALLPERLNLIRRIDERLRNDPVFKSTLNKSVDSVVGPKGFMVYSALNQDRLGISDEQARAIEQDIDAVWGEWQSDCDYAGNPARCMNFATMLGLQYSTRLTRGETFTIPRYRKRPWSRFSFCLQNVTPERIVSPMGYAGTYGSIDGEDIRDGVKIGTDGSIVGIYVCRRHPWSHRFSAQGFETDYIPAYNRRTGRANFWHRFFPYRMEATRGEPAFAACLAGFKSLGDYMGDELTRARLATMFGLAVYREEAFDPDLEAITDSNDLVGSTSERARQQMDWYSGQINYLQPGDRVDVVNPNLPGPQFKDFTESLATWSASPLPLSREQILNDFKGLSWSSGKIARDEAERATEREQEDVMVDYIMPVRERVIEEAYLRGYIDLPGFEDPVLRKEYFRSAFFAPKRPYLEPVKEATGAKIRMETSTSTLALECARLGQSMDSVLLGQQRELQMRKRLGLAIPAHLEAPPLVSPTTSKSSTDDQEDQNDEGSNSDA